LKPGNEPTLSQPVGSLPLDERTDLAYYSTQGCNRSYWRSTPPLPTVNDTIADLNEAALKILAAVQAGAVEANRAAAGFVQARRAAPPAWLRVPESVSPETLVQQGFEFGTKVVEADRTFALDLIEAWTPKA
jgi:hypothetical protein